MMKIFLLVSLALLNRGVAFVTFSRPSQIQRRINTGAVVDVPEFWGRQRRSNVIVAAGDLLGFEEAMKKLEELESIDDDVDTTSLPDLEGEEKMIFDSLLTELKTHETVPSDEPVTGEPQALESLKSLDDVLEMDFFGDDGMSGPQDTERDVELAKIVEDAINTSLMQIDDPSGNLTEAKESVLEDTQLREEISKIFDQGAQELREELEKIRSSELSSVRKSAEKNADESANQLAAEEERLRTAQKQMVSMYDRVKDETREVEAAMKELEAAQAALENDPLTMLLKIRDGGIVKQSALAGTLLFTFRSLGDAIAMGGIDGDTHATAAVIQAAIAVACAVLFLVT